MNWAVSLLNQSHSLLWQCADDHPELFLAFFLDSQRRVSTTKGAVCRKNYSAEFCGTAMQQLHQPSKWLISKGHLPDRMAVKMHNAEFESVIHTMNSLS